MTNASGFGGGGISNNDGAHLLLIGTTILDNSCTLAGSGGYSIGGGIVNHVNSFAEISQSVITGNESGWAVGGGIANDALATLKLLNVLIYNNHALDAAGLYNNGTCDAVNVTIADNKTTESYPDATGFSSPGTFNLINSILWDTIMGSRNTIHTQNSLIKGIEGNESDVDGRDLTHEQVFDERFSTASYYAYRLSESSPAINVGDNDLVETTNDLDGKPRIYGGIVDLGVFEYQGDRVYPPFNDGLIQVSGACLGTPTVFQVDRFDRDSIHWDFGDGSQMMTYRKKNLSLEHEYLKEGTYTVRIVVFSGKKQEAFTKTVTVKAIHLFIGKDTSICPNTAITLISNVSDATYLWQDGSTQSSLTVHTAGIYWLEVKKDGCSASDTLTVTNIKIPALTITGNQSFCEGDTIFLNVEPANWKDIHWADGHQGASLPVTHSGTYKVEAKSEEGCLVSNQVEVHAIPLKKLTVSGNRGFCEGDSITLRVTNTDVKDIYWNNGFMGPTFTLFEGSTVTVRATTEEGCPATTEIKVNTPYAPPVRFLSPALDLCNGTTLEIVPNQFFSKYIWSIGSTQPSIYVNTAGLYTLRVEDVNGCTGIDSVHISLKECDGDLLFPNAFTPNQDGINDKFGPVAPNGINVRSFKLMIFNRWGNLVFSSTNMNEQWDGTFHGHQLPTGSYVWDCTYQTINGKSSKHVNGVVVLLR